MHTNDGVRLIKNDPIGIAICRIMNDYRPLSAIIKTLIKDSEEILKEIYLYISLCQYCYPYGLKTHVLQGLISKSIHDIINRENPLKIKYNVNDSHYINVQNEAMSSVFLDIYKQENYINLYKAMVKLAKAFAPYVNRDTIKQQTPEARASRRLMNYSDAVNKYISNDSEQFYSEIQSEWEWNSRYWEQRALGILNFDLELALQYAKHAVSIEEHPFTLNTYATVLHEHMKKYQNDADDYFYEILSILDLAINKEYSRSRITVYPLTTLLSATITYLHQNNAVDRRAKEKVYELIDIVTSVIPNKDRFDNLIDTIESLW